MNRKIQLPIKTALVILGIFILALSITTQGQEFWTLTSKFLGVYSRDKISEENDFIIHFLDVGKADCALIESVYGNFLIDGAIPTYEDYILSYVKKRKIEELDAVFISHFDYDHYSGLIPLMNEIPIKSIYANISGEGGYSFGEFIDLADKKGIEIIQIGVSDVLSFGEINIDVLSPNREYETSNEMSVVMKMTFRDFSALFTGDLEYEALEDIISLENALKSTVLKVPHHGSKNGMNEEFLEYVDPVVSVISAGDNASNLPSKEAVKLLEDYTYFHTHSDRTIIVSTNGDGKMIISTQEKTYEKTYN